MRRRTPARAGSAAGEPPEELRWRGWVAFLIPDEPVPDWVERGDRQKHRNYMAYRRWQDARKRWAADNGVDYVATFHPEWLRHRAGNRSNNNAGSH